MRRGKANRCCTMNKFGALDEFAKKFAKTGECD
jgi:hypothetical protein